MEILTISALVASIVIYDEVLNGQMKVSQKLLNWFEKKDTDNNQTKTYSKK